LLYSDLLSLNGGDKHSNLILDDMTEGPQRSCIAIKAEKIITNPISMKDKYEDLLSDML
jgi:hypothetical protein